MDERIRRRNRNDGHKEQVTEGTETCWRCIRTQDRPEIARCSSLLGTTRYLEMQPKRSQCKVSVASLLWNRKTSAAEGQPLVAVSRRTPPHFSRPKSPVATWQSETSQCKRAVTDVLWKLKTLPVDASSCNMPAQNNPCFCIRQHVPDRDSRPRHPVRT